MQAKWHRSMVLGSILCGSLLATQAVAGDQKSGMGGYVGAGFGMIDVNDSDFEDDDTTVKGYAGAKFGDLIGIELGVHDYGESSNGAFEWELEGVTVAVMAFLPFHDNFEVFIKGGNLWWDAEVSATGPLGQFFEDDLEGNEFFFGGGLQFNFTDNFALRAEYERYKLDLEEDEIGFDVEDDSNINIASVGVQINF